VFVSYGLSVKVYQGITLFGVIRIKELIYEGVSVFGVLMY
jgi:hypothetical protein